MHPGVATLNLIGPHFMFGSVMSATMLLVAKSPDPVTTDTGVMMLPTATFDTHPRDLTMRFTPRDTGGTLAAANASATRAAVCSGLLILGAAGLLKGYKATCHWPVRDVLAGFGAILTDARVVHDQPHHGRGRDPGLDFELMMVGKLRDRTYVECCQIMGEYSPHSPFNTGLMHTAQTEVKAPMIQMLAEFKQKTGELAKASQASP